MRVRVLASLAIIVLASPAAASAAFPHVVESGESLSSVAASDGLTVEQLAAANGLSPEAPLIEGTTLQIPEQGEASAPSEGETSQAVESEGGESSSSSAGASYVVQPGDTLSAIAARSGMSVEGLAAANGLEPNGTLLAGTILNVAGGGSGLGSSEAGPVEAVNAPPYPTEESVSPAEVGAIAEEHGVPASFAEAIAEQESGFNNALTSSADARGEMQIIPETWNFINQELAGSTLEPASAASNVRGGVLYLRWLLGETGGDPGLAAAGYYQGIESVRQEGELPETEEYVSNVLALQSRFAGG
jgi:N-acetylmuramoyl-L-alanine amidase